MTDVSVHFVYVTAADSDEAGRLAEIVIEERLAACANIFPPMTSVYHWEGEIKRSAEVAFLLKTTGEKIPALTARIKELHSYENPCVVAWPIEKGLPQFLEWVARETTDPRVRP